MNKKLRKQIKAYSGIAGTILIADKANGQIIYHDIIPDTTINAPANSGWHFIDIDIDNDLITDFKLKTRLIESTGASSFGLEEIRVTPFNGNQILNDSIPCDCYCTSGSTFQIVGIKLCNQGQLINTGTMWRGSNAQFLFGGTWDSAAQFFCGYDGSGYIAFRLLKSLCYYYGWIRLNVNSGNSFTVKDFAYDTICNAPIIVGDTSFSSVGLEKLNPVFQIIQHNKIIEIVSTEHLNHANISVYDLLGKEILQQPFEGKEATIKIDRKGIYFVEVKSEKGIFRKKVFIY